MLRGGGMTTSGGIALGFGLVGCRLALNLDVGGGGLCLFGGLADFGFGVFGGVLGDSSVPASSGIGAGGLGSGSVGGRSIGGVTTSSGDMTAGSKESILTQPSPPWPPPSPTH